MLSEADVRIEIDEALKNKGWKLTGSDKNVLTERTNLSGRADYVLKARDRETPIIIIEAKRKGKDLNEALEQAKKYAHQFKAPIAYASDGSTIKTIHLTNLKPLMLNGEEVDHFVTESLALQYLHTNEHNTIGQKVIQSRKELITIFANANKELRKEGLQAGVERFSEFCNILFLKIFSEEVEMAEESGTKLHTSIQEEFRWNYFKNKDGKELLHYVNDVVLRYFQKEYGEDIFSPLQLQNPIVLKRIIDNLDPLSLVDTNSDIKGDAFEYFLKAYLANQNKDLGEYFTPRHVVKTLVKLVNPKFGETIYDPFCGTGGMLIESFKHIYNKMPMSDRNLDMLKKETIFGGEITKNARITKMNMILTGDGHNNIVKQDSLKNPSRKKYDVVITNMPFSLGNFDDYSGFYKLGSANGNSLCIEHCFDAINENSSNPRIGIIVPEGILFNKNFTKLREYIYKNSHVQDIISLPSGTFKPYTDVKTSILYLTQVNKKKSEQKAVWHFIVKNDGYTLNTKRQRKEGENDLDIFLSFNDTENESNLLEIGFNKLDMEAIKNNNYISIPSPYKKFEFNSSFKTLQLGELVDEITTRNTINAEVWSVTNDKGLIPTQERFEEQVASDNTENYKIVLPHSFAYNPSRINVGSIAYNNSNKTGCVSPMYVILKVKNEHRLDSKYLYWLLQSKQLKEQIKLYAFGSVRQTLNFSDFCKITIPLPSIEDQEEIVKQLKKIDNSIQHAESLVKSLKATGLSFSLYGQTESSMMKLSEISELITDGIHNTPKLEIDGVPMLDGENILDFIICSHKPRKFISIETDLLLSKRCKPQENDILLTSRGTIGKLAIVQKNQDFNIMGNIILIRVNANVALPKFILYALDQEFYNLNNLARGTSQKGLYLNQIRNYEIPIPSLKIQEKIVKECEEEINYIRMTEKMIKKQKEKIDLKLKEIWIPNKDKVKDEPIADKSLFDTMISKATKPTVE